jgi:hypothetical protein
MAIDTTKTVCVDKKINSKSSQETEGLILEADYEEDRPISLLAARRREFLKKIQGRFVDDEMPADR